MAQPQAATSSILIKPNQLDGLPNLTAEQKAAYKNGLNQLWQHLQSLQQGSNEYREQENKIRAASVKIMQQISRKPGASGGQAAGNGQQAPQQPPKTSGQGAPGGAQAGAPNASAQGMQQQGSQQGQPAQASGQPPPALNDTARRELGGIQIALPQEVIQSGQAHIQNYKKQFYQRGGNILLRREQVRTKGSMLQTQIRSGQGDLQQAQQDFEKCKSDLQAAQNEWENFKKQNDIMAQKPGSQLLPLLNGNQQQSQAQDMSQRPGSMSGLNAGQQQLPGDMNQQAQQQQRSAMSPTQPQGSFQQQAQPLPSPAQQNMQQQQQPASTHPQQQTPQTATQSHPPQGFPHQGNAQQPNQQQRPPMNPQQMSQQSQQNMNMQQQHPSTPNTALPQSATQQQLPRPQPQPHQQQGQPQQPQALSQQAALSQASVERQNAAQQQQNPPPGPQMPNVPNGLPFNAPASATNQTPTSGFPQLPQQTSSSTKFPIPKQLTLDPRTQGPVQGPASRPTMSASGMMSQPGIQRPAQFTLEGEGDRVLSKRKLDELVRQVTGSAESETDGLAPEVEESVLTLADDFVDNVITSACKMAKLRSSQTLDVRDVQIVLERNYGIRIPGYGLDEIRTVRKFQPAEGWRSKMQAVQAGKVMGGTGGRDT